MPSPGPNAPGNGSPAPDSRAPSVGTNGQGGSAAAANPAVQKLESDVIKLIDVIASATKLGEGHSLRLFAERSGLSKDEVNRYLNPQVNEVYNVDRLVHVRSRNRPLYNHLIVSGPPSVGDDGKWAGILTNTSKFPLFRAVAQRYGWDVKFVGDRGLIVDVQYRGIEEMAVERMGKVFSSQEPTLYIE